jgi:hypothetical protein
MPAGQLLLPLCTLHPGVQKPAGGVEVWQSFPCVHSESSPHPQSPDDWHTGLFSGVHCDPLLGEHCVHLPASVPDLLHAGWRGSGHMSGCGVVPE